MDYKDTLPYQERQEAQRAEMEAPLWEGGYGPEWDEPDQRELAELEHENRKALEARTERVRQQMRERDRRRRAGTKHA